MVAMFSLIKIFNLHFSVRSIREAVEPRIRISRAKFRIRASKSLNKIKTYRKLLVNIIYIQMLLIKA